MKIDDSLIQSFEIIKKSEENTDSCKYQLIHKKSNLVVDLEVFFLKNFFCNLDVHHNGKKIIETFYFDKSTSATKIVEKISDYVESLVMPIYTEDGTRIDTLHYYLDDNAKKIGPLSLKEMVMTKKIHEDNIIWRSDHKKWQKATEYKEFLEFLVPIEPLSPREAKIKKSKEDMRKFWFFFKILIGILFLISSISSFTSYYVNLKSKNSYNSVTRLYGIETYNYEAETSKLGYAIIFLIIALFLFLFRSRKKN